MRLPFFLLCYLLTQSVVAAEQRVVVETSLGTFTVELFASKAPITASRFLELAKQDAYAGTIFHRVIPGFMIQAGGYFDDLSAAEELEPITNEASLEVSNAKWTLALARTDGIDSGSRQFFVNLRDNDHLDHKVNSCTREDEREQLERVARGLSKPLRCASYGYAVFGRVVAGFDVVEDIELVETDIHEDFLDLPVTPVQIISTTVE